MTRRTWMRRRCRPSTRCRPSLSRQRARCCMSAASAAAPAPSATLCVSVKSIRIAAATSSSLTETMSSASRRSTSSASETGVRQAMPSASRVLTGASTTLSGSKRIEVGRRVRRNDTNEPGGDAAMRTGGRGAGKAGTQADRHEQHIRRSGRQRLEEFDPAGCHAAHQFTMKRWHAMQPVAFGQEGGMLARGLELVAVLDERHAQRAHGRVLLERIPVRHHDGRGDAVAPRSEADRLAVVAARGADDVPHVGLFARQRLEVA